MITACMLKSGSRFANEKENEKRVIFLKSSSHMRNFLQTYHFFLRIRYFSHEYKSHLISAIKKEKKIQLESKIKQRTAASYHDWLHKVWLIQPKSLSRF